MPQREHARKHGRPEHDAEEMEQPPGSRVEQAAGTDVDELLEDIDEVLEANAEDFVKSFVQKGGQ